MRDLLECPMYIAQGIGIPWHNHNVHTHLSYSSRLRETTLTLFTKDHKKIIKITDDEYHKLTTSYEKNNWELIRKREWQKELMALHQNMGD